MRVACRGRRLERLRPLLEVLGGNVVLVGAEPGQGQLAKVLNNLLSASAIAITGEALTLGVHGGLSARTLLDVFNASSGRNTASADNDLGAAVGALWARAASSGDE